MADTEAEFATMAAKFSPDVEARGLAILAALRARLPSAQLLVYDNYNALAVGFAPALRTSDAILSVVFYPKWISLFFLQAANLDDPAGIFKGAGTVARHIVLADAAALDRPEIAAMIDQALSKARVKLPPGAGGKLVIKSVSAKQRPRRSAKI